MNLKRIFGATVVAAALLCPGITVAAPKKPAANNKPDTCVYKVKLKSSYGNEGTREMYVKGKNYRWDYHSGDAHSGIVMDNSIIRNKDGAFLYLKSRKRVGKYAAGDPSESPMYCVVGPQGDVKAFIKEKGAKKLKAEKVGKKLCDVYTYKVVNDRYKLYVDPKTMTPVQITIAAPMPKGKTFHRTITYTSYKRGVEVSDSLFTLPKDIPVRPMRPRGAKPSEPGNP